MHLTGRDIVGRWEDDQFPFTLNLIRFTRNYEIIPLANEKHNFQFRNLHELVL